MDARRVIVAGLRGRMLARRASRAARTAYRFGRSAYSAYRKGRSFWRALASARNTQSTQRYSGYGHSLGFVKRSSNLINGLFHSATTGSFKMMFGLTQANNSQVIYGGFLMLPQKFMPYFLYVNRLYYETFKLYQVDCRVQLRSLDISTSSADAVKGQLFRLSICGDSSLRNKYGDIFNIGYAAVSQGLLAEYPQSRYVDFVPSQIGSYPPVYCTIRPEANVVNRSMSTSLLREVQKEVTDPVMVGTKSTLVSELDASVFEYTDQDPTQKFFVPAMGFSLATMIPQVISPPSVTATFDVQFRFRFAMSGYLNNNYPMELPSSAAQQMVEMPEPSPENGEAVENPEPTYAATE